MCAHPRILFGMQWLLQANVQTGPYCQTLRVMLLQQSVQQSALRTVS